MDYQAKKEVTLFVLTTGLSYVQQNTADFLYSRKHFSEESLWQFFECFARGLNLMDHGNESPERKEDGRNPMCKNP